MNAGTPRSPVVGLSSSRRYVPVRNAQHESLHSQIVLSHLGEIQPTARAIRHGRVVSVVTVLYAGIAGKPDSIAIS